MTGNRSATTVALRRLGRALVATGRGRTAELVTESLREGRLTPRRFRDLLATTGGHDV
jgi:hypothetical protein